jgi:hypothetical protein
MDNVLTISDWWDGPVMGLATYNDVICIYSRVFDIPEPEDEYLDEYFLTPISDAEVKMIMNEWNEWCVACSKNDLDSFYKKYQHNHALHRVWEKSCEKDKYRKRATFTGSIGSGFIPVDLCVEWHD